MLQFLDFSEDVTLTTGALPGTLAAAFDTNPVTPPGASGLTISGTGGTAAGSYTFDVIGTSSPSSFIHDVSVGLDLFDQVPGVVVLTSPADAATDVVLVPLLEWDAAVQAASYELEVATDAAFTDIVYTAPATGTSHTLEISLEPVTEYYWRVRGVNVCGVGTYSAAFRFTTRAIPPILLVDDDDNGPDARMPFLDALGDLERAFDVWDTGNSDTEPSALQLAPYDIVIWFTGDEFGGSAGPGAAGETALGEWLDSGDKCLFLSSQDYHFDRGLTAFMQTYLGVSAVSNDTDQTTVTGAGSVFDGFGPYTLVYPFDNFSDTVTADATAEVAFTGDQGDAAVNKDGGIYKTVFFGYPFGALPAAADREQVLQAIFEFCSAALFTDGFESGDTSAWSNAVGE